MAEPSLNDDPFSDNQPGASSPEHGGEPGDESAPPRAKFNFKMLAVMAVAIIGGALLGGGAVMGLLSFLQPAPHEPSSAPVIAEKHAEPTHAEPAHADTPHADPTHTEPAQDPKQVALKTELEEFKAKNEKLEEQLKQLSQTAPAAPAPTIIHSKRSAGKTKIAADCTVPVKGEKLSDKLKSCIEDFNSSTN